MQRICAWCKKKLTPRENLGTEREITHGICSICALKFTRDIPRKTKEILDVISEPVLVVDSLGKVKTANKSGLKMLGKDLHSVEEHFGGDVLECSYARLPEGCGNTEHCKTCAIRNILMDTLTYGRGYKKVPAFQKVRTSSGERIMRYYISTEKVGEHILLRIDDAEEKLLV
ncbi:MAG: PAS domain-containing protein [Desulfobulbales bacterium]